VEDYEYARKNDEGGVSKLIWSGGGIGPVVGMGAAIFVSGRKRRRKAIAKKAAPSVRLKRTLGVQGGEG